MTLLSISIASSYSANAQKVLNITGAYIRINDYNLSYSVGEMSILTHYGNTSYLAQGVLQPIFALIPSKPLVTLPLPRAVCLGESVEIPFTTNIKFNSDNEFTLELSDQNGSFTDSMVIAKVKSTTLRKIPVQIPSNLDPTKNYFLRVRSSSPESLGSPTNLLVRIKPTASFSIDEVACTGNPIVATFTGKDTIANSNYIWLFEGSGIIEKVRVRYQQSITWNSTTRTIKDTVRLVVDNNGCKSDTAKKVVTIEPSLAKPRLTCGKLSGNAITFNWAQVGGAHAYRIIRATYPDTVVRNNSISFANLPSYTKIHLEVQALGDGLCGFSRDTLSCATLICPTYQASFFTNQVNICAGSSAHAEINLSSSKAVNGLYVITYTANGGQPEITRIFAGDPLVFKPEQTTTYNITNIAHELFNGCSTFFNNLTFQVNVASNYSSGMPEAPLLVCDNQDSPILLNNLLKGEDINGHWTVIPSLDPDAFDADERKFIPKGQDAATYTFTYTVPAKGNGCISRSSAVEIKLERKLEVEIKDYSNCLNANDRVVVDLKKLALRVNRFAPNLVTWYNDLAGTDEIKQNREIAAPTTLFAKVGQGKCGAALAPILITPGEKLALPIIEGSDTYTVGDKINLSTNRNYPPGSYFIWVAPDTVVDGTDLYYYPALIATKKRAGYYKLVVADVQSPCVSDTAFITITVREPDEPELIISKNFSENKPWEIKGLEAYPNHVIQVWNRWGELVFKSEGTYNNDWNGTFSKKPLAQGTYYYQIETGVKDKDPAMGAIYFIKTQ